MGWVGGSGFWEIGCFQDLKNQSAEQSLNFEGFNSVVIRGAVEVPFRGRAHGAARPDEG